MKNIIISIFITLFIILLLNTIVSKFKCNKVIEGMEGTEGMEDDDDENLTIKQRFKKLENRVSKIQQQISDAETVNETNKKMLKNMEKK